MIICSRLQDARDGVSVLSPSIDRPFRAAVSFVGEVSVEEGERGQMAGGVFLDREADGAGP